MRDMNIIMAFNTGFLLPALTAVYSLFINNSNVRLFVLYADLSDSAKQAVKKFEKVNDRGNTVEFIELPEALINRIRVSTGRWRPECFFRYFVIDLLSDADRALWLDSDIIVRKSINELYNTDMEGRSFAGVCDVTSNPMERLGIKYYINSGVLLFDLEKLRQTGMIDRFWDLVASPDYAGDLPDQDALNIVFKDDIRLLDCRYNAFPLSENEYADYLIENTVIVHYISGHKPWNMNEVEYFYTCFEKYRTAEVFIPEYWDMCDKATAFIE